MSFETFGGAARFSLSGRPLPITSNCPAIKQKQMIGASFTVESTISFRKPADLAASSVHSGTRRMHCVPHRAHQALIDARAWVRCHRAHRAR